MKPILRLIVVAIAAQILMGSSSCNETHKGSAIGNGSSGTSGTNTPNGSGHVQRPFTLGEAGK